MSVRSTKAISVEPGARQATVTAESRTSWAGPSLNGRTYAFVA